jgi:putative addiction module component (TIGR02574 family)
VSGVPLADGSRYARRMASSHSDELLRRALELPPDERLALATELLNSVEEPEDERWAAAWLAELDRRSAAIDRGEDKLEDWETVKTRLRAELRAK